MKYRAVIFDLGGTLVPALPWTQQQNTLRRMAEAMHLSPDDFIRVWYSISNERMKGILGGSKDFIRDICRRLGVNVNEGLINIAADIELDHLTLCVTKPRADSLYVLRSLKSLGFGIGLISDCSSEVPDLWRGTVLAPLVDISIFSCLTGTRKPDPRLFRMALDALTVKAESCLYVADGIGRELAGATAMGIRSCMLHITGENDDDPYREKWSGPIISSLTEVLDLVSMES